MFPLGKMSEEYWIGMIRMDRNGGHLMSLTMKGGGKANGRSALRQRQHPSPPLSSGAFQKHSPESHRGSQFVSHRRTATGSSPHP